MQIRNSPIPDGVITPAKTSFPNHLYTQLSDLTLSASDWTTYCAAILSSSGDFGSDYTGPYLAQNQCHLLGTTADATVSCRLYYGGLVPYITVSETTFSVPAGATVLVAFTSILVVTAAAGADVDQQFFSDTAGVKIIGTQTDSVHPTSMLLLHV